MPSQRSQVVVAPILRDELPAERLLYLVYHCPVRRGVIGLAKDRGDPLHETGGVGEVGGAIDLFSPPAYA